MLKKTQSWKNSLLVYKDIRMLRILLLGSISGFPWVLIASSLSLWLKEEGLSRSTIGWAGLIFGVYAFMPKSINDFNWSIFGSVYFSVFIFWFLP